MKGTAKKKYHSVLKTVNLIIIIILQEQYMEINEYNSMVNGIFHTVFFWLLVMVVVQG